MPAPYGSRLMIIMPMIIMVPTETTETRAMNAARLTQGKVREMTVPIPLSDLIIEARLRSA
jgi:hypothetical protein